MATLSWQSSGRITPTSMPVRCDSSNAEGASSISVECRSSTTDESPFRAQYASQCPSEPSESCRSSLPRLRRATQRVLRLASPFPDRGFSTTVLLPDDSGKRSRDGCGWTRRVKLRLGRLRESRSVSVQRESPGALVRDVPRLKDIIRSGSFDLVVVHGVCESAAYAARRCGVPSVIHRCPQPIRVSVAGSMPGHPSGKHLVD